MTTVFYVRACQMEGSVRVNVGGTRFETTRDTLCRYPGSYFDALLSDRWVDGSAELFVDRDPVTFAHVLSFLRGYPVTANADVLHALHADAVFYGLTDFAERLRGELGIRTEREELAHKKRCIQRIAAMRTVLSDGTCDYDDLDIENDVEELEGTLRDLEESHEDALVAIQAEMLLTWAPALLNTLCPLLEKQFGVDLRGFVVGRDFVPLVEEFVRYYRDRDAFGPVGEILVKFLTDAYAHSCLRKPPRPRGFPMRTTNEYASLGASAIARFTR